MLMMLGNSFIFTIGFLPFEELQRTRRWRWAEHPIVGKHSKLQFTGADSESIVLRGTAYPGQLSAGSRIPDFALVKLAELSGKFKQPLPLVSGGRVAQFWGFWVIESFQVVETYFLKGSSVPRKQTFDISLKQSEPPPPKIL